MDSLSSCLFLSHDVEDPEMEEVKVKVKVKCGSGSDSLSFAFPFRLVLERMIVALACRIG